MPAWALVVRPFGAIDSAQRNERQAEDMRIRALADSADRIHGHGRSDFVLEDEDTYIDATTGTNPLGESCAKTPVRLKWSDGVAVIKRIDMCE
jgi:hypothetical protein